MGRDALFPVDGLIIPRRLYCGMRDEDWGYMSESEKLGRISAAEDRNQRDREA